MRLFPPALSLIIILTAVSVETCPPYFREAAVTAAGGLDIALNLLLYVPIGIALRKRGFLVVGAFACALSLIAESIQFFYPDRYASPFDLAANTAGALFGAGVARAVSPFTGVRSGGLRLGRSTGVFAAIFFAALLATLSRPTEPADFSNWDSTHELAVGDEPSGGRLWNGTITELAIYDDRLPTAAIAEIAKDNLRALVQPAGPIPVYQTPGPLVASDSLWGQPLLDAWRRGDMFRAMTHENRLTVLVRFLSHDSYPSGPATIVTFSEGPLLRNFTLAVDGRRIVFRLRTPQSGLEGIYPQAMTPEVIRKNRATFVAATYDGHVSRVYVDGRLLARVNLASQHRVIPFLADSGLPAAAFLVGMLAATWALCFVAPRRRRGAWPVAVLAALGAAALFHVLGADSSLPTVRAWLPFFGLAGGLVAAGSATR
jgi:hypothetical protein